MGRTMKRIHLSHAILVAITAVFVAISLSGCKFIESFTSGFQEGVNDALNGASSSSTASKKEDKIGINGPFYKTLKDSNSTKQQKLDALSSQIEFGDLYLQQVAAIRRFGIEHDIDIPTHSQSEKINSILEALYNGQEFIDKSYWVEECSELFRGKYYKTIEESGYSITLYYGDLKNGRPDGYGMIYYIFNGDIMPEDEYITIIDYIGHFSNGRRDGYGMQYYSPTTFQLGKLGKIICDYLEQKYELDVDFIVHNNDDSRLCSCDWCNHYRQAEELVIRKYLNIVEYEGEFKNNKYNGRGVMDLEYNNTFHDSIEDIEIDDLRLCYRRVISECDDCRKLIIGDFKGGDASDNCKTYYG